MKLIWKGQTILSCSSRDGLLVAFEGALRDHDFPESRIVTIVDDAAYELEAQGQYGFGRWLLTEE